MVNKHNLFELDVFSQILRHEQDVTQGHYLCRVFLVLIQFYFWLPYGGKITLLTRLSTHSWKGEIDREVKNKLHRPVFERELAIPFTNR